MSFSAVARYLAEYERAGLRQGAAPPPRLKAALAEARLVFASDAIRVTQSLAALGLNETAVRDSLFAEEPLALFRLCGVWPLSFWLAASRAPELWGTDSRANRHLLRERAALRLRTLVMQGVRPTPAALRRAMAGRPN